MTDTASPAPDATPTIPEPLQQPVADAVVAAKSIEKGILEGARTLIETALSSTEGALEKVVPEFEHGAIVAAVGFLPPQVQPFLQSVIALSGQPLSLLNERLDQVGQAFLKIAIARIDSTVDYLAG